MAGLLKTEFFNMDWFQTIFGTELYGFVKMRSGNVQRFANLDNLRNPEKLRRQLQAKYFTSKNFYISLCTYKTAENGSQKNLTGIQGFQVDIDYKKMKEYKEFTHEQIIWILEKDYFNQEIPIPTLIETSNNLRLIYIFNSPVGATKKSIALINKIIKKFSNAVAFMGGDAQTVNSMIRVPGSINTKTGDVVSSEVYSDYKYELSDIVDGWMDDYYKPRINKNGKVITLPKTTYSLNQLRLKDLEYLVALRGRKMDGCRANFFFIYSSILMTTGITEKSMEKKVHSLNQSLVHPIPHVLTKINRKKYRFKNDTIIDKLNITEEELSQLKTIISKSEKAKRRSIRHKETYVGKTTRIKKKEQALMEITGLKMKGFTQKEIAEKTGYSLSTVKNYLKKEKLEKNS